MPEDQNSYTKHATKNRDAPDREKSRRILVVEDDRTHRALMMQILKNLGHAVASAENGVAALKRLEKGVVFDLVILDWDMPICNGLETIREIRARQRRGELAYFPVVAFTSYNRADVRESCINAGMDGYMPKDVWMPRWRETLQHNLNSFFNGHFDTSAFDEALGKGTPYISPEDHNVQFDHALFEDTAQLLADDLLHAVDYFLEDAQSYIDAIIDAADKNDLETITCATHPLKSNTKSFGLIGLSRLIERINQLAHEEDTKTLTLPVAVVQDCFEQSRTVLERAAQKYKRENTV